MNTADWVIWFWFLVAVMVLASCICAAATYYGCCYSEDNSCHCFAVSCCCCCDNHYNEYSQNTNNEDRERFTRFRPRTPEFYDDYLTDSLDNTNSYEERNEVSSSPVVLSNAAQVARARRLLPFCKIFKFTSKNTFLTFKRPKKCKNDVCPICIEQYMQGDSLVLCPCKHAYHLNCLEGWLKVKGICPLCKRPIRNEMSERSPLLYPYI